MMACLKRLIEDERGATAIEYGIIISLVSISAVGALYIIGPALVGMFEAVSEGF